MNKNNKRIELYETIKAETEEDLIAFQCTVIKKWRIKILKLKNCDYGNVKGEIGRKKK